MRRTLLVVWALLGGIPNPVAGATADSPALRTGASEGIPYRKSDDGADAGATVRVITGLGVVLLIGVGAIYLMKKYLPGAYGVGTAGAQKIRLVEVRRLTPRLTLFAIEYQGKKLLLAHSGDRVTTVADAGGVAAEPDSAQAGSTPHG